MKKKILKLFILLLAVILFVAIIIYLTPLMKQISTQEGQLEFKQKIDELGIKGVIVLFLLQLAQIALVILPGEPLEILAGMCYGTVGGTIFIFASVFVTTTIIYALVKKYGRKYIYESFEKEKVDKIENSKALKNPKTVEYILTILFLIPGTPKDLLTYIGAVLPISYKKFILIATFARFPSVVSSTIAGSNIVQAKWQFVITVYVVTFILTGVIMFITNKLDKNKVTKDALNSLK